MVGLWPCPTTDMTLVGLWPCPTIVFDSNAARKMRGLNEYSKLFYSGDCAGWGVSPNPSALRVIKL